MNKVLCEAAFLLDHNQLQAPGTEVHCASSIIKSKYVNTKVYATELGLIIETKRGNERIEVLYSGPYSAILGE